jgi:hypothetical protein
MRPCSWQLFYLNSFQFSKIESKYVKFKIQISQTILDEKKCQNESCRTSKVIQLYSWQLFISIRLWSQTSNLHSVGCNIWTKNYKVDTKHAIVRMVVEGDGEVGGLIPNNRIAPEFYAKNCDLRLRRRRAGGVGRVLSLNNFFVVFKTRLMFLKIIFTIGFITSTAQWKSIFTSNTHLAACKNDDFYWVLVPTVLKNVSENRFITVTIEIICINASMFFRL